MGTLWASDDTFDEHSNDEDMGGLFARMLLTWLVLFAGVWLIRAKPWRPARRTQARPKIGRTTLVDMPARLSNLIHYVPGATLARMLFSVIIVGALIHWMYDIPVWWNRAGSERVAFIARADDGAHEKYGPLVGMARVQDAFVCTSDAMRLAVPEGVTSTQQTLFILVNTTGSSTQRVHLVAIPMDGSEHYLSAALLRYRSMPVHFYGYQMNLMAPALTIARSKSCTALARGPTGNWGSARGLFVVDPRPPNHYRTELIGMVLLVLLVGGTIGYAWSMLTFRRWWQEKIERES
jgi:hypothetical protein